MNILGITHMFYCFGFIENIRIQLMDVRDYTIAIILVIIVGCIIYYIRNDGNMNG